MLYRNKVTGVLLDSISVIAGGDWELIDPDKKPAEKTEAVKTAAKAAPKKGK